MYILKIKIITVQFWKQITFKTLFVGDYSSIFIFLLFINLYLDNFEKVNLVGLLLFCTFSD